MDIGAGLEISHQQPTLNLPDMKSLVDSNGDDCYDYENENPAKNEIIE